MNAFGDMAESPIVELEDVKKSFKLRGNGLRSPQEFHALRGVTATIFRGQSVGVVGESGSGKTTLARIIAGLESPSSGRVTINGILREAKPSLPSLRLQASTLQMVFQDPNTSLNPKQSIHDAIDEVQKVHFKKSKAEREIRTRELLDATGLGQREATARPRDLSGGQRQRAAIARALAADPKMLVLDEAVSSLDVSVQAQILNLLADLRDEFQLTYIFISHDLAVIRFLCESVLVMNRGSIVEAGNCGEVLTAPRNEYTQRLVASVPKAVFN